MNETDHSDIEVLADEFRAVAPEGTKVRCIGEGFRFTEGPVWWNGQLLFSDIPADVIYRWTPDDGCRPWREPSRYANGNTTDLEGRLITCEHGSRSLTRTEGDGGVITLAETHAGKRLNSPNDVVVDRAGSLWFTDPPYGIKPDQSEQDANYVFRLDPGATEPDPVADDFSRPNGLCFSPDHERLYIADSDTSLHHIRVFDVTDERTLTGGQVFTVVEPGVPDGIRTDRDGRVYSTSAEGVHVFTPDGRLIGKIRTPETAANCTFGGPDGRTLFITACTRVWAVELAVTGADVK